LPANAKINTCDDEVEVFEWSDRDPGHVVELQRTLQQLETVETMMELKEATTAVDTSADEEGPGSANKRKKI